MSGQHRAVAGGIVIDREEQRLRLKERIEAAQQRIDELRVRREQISLRAATAGDVQRARNNLRKASLRAVAAQFAVVRQLERCADASDAAARAHDYGAEQASVDLAAIAHLHLAEGHRSAAHQYREQAKRYRDSAERCTSEDDV